MRAKNASLSRWLTLLSVLVLTACSAAPHTASPPPPHASPAAAAASKSSAPAIASPPAPATTPAIAATHGPCPRTARLGRGSSSGFPEQQGVGVGATLWALFFGDEVVAGQEIKVVWRMTGSGGLSISATGPDAKIVQPEWGPESHGSSSWDRPGGTG